MNAQILVRTRKILYEQEKNCTNEFTREPIRSLAELVRTVDMAGSKVGRQNNGK